jgi:hypothetical protein
MLVADGGRRPFRGVQQQGDDGVTCPPNPAGAAVEMRKCRRWLQIAGGPGDAAGQVFKTEQKRSVFMNPLVLRCARLPHGLELTANGKFKVARIEERELEDHRAEIVADVEKLVEKYRRIFDWDVPDIDQAAADRLILQEVRKALGELEEKLLG